MLKDWEYVLIRVHLLMQLCGNQINDKIEYLLGDLLNESEIYTIDRLGYIFIWLQHD